MYRLVILKLPHHSWTECCIHSYQSHHFLKVSSNWQVSLGRRLLLWQPTQTECDSYMCRVTTSKLREYRMHLLLAVVANGGRVNAYTCGLRGRTAGSSLWCALLQTHFQTSLNGPGSRLDRGHKHTAAKLKSSSHRDPQLLWPLPLYVVNFLLIIRNAWQKRVVFCSHASRYERPTNTGEEWVVSLNDAWSATSATLPRVCVHSNNPHRPFSQQDMANNINEFLFYLCCTKECMHDCN